MIGWFLSSVYAYVRFLNLSTDSIIIVVAVVVVAIVAVVAAAATASSSDDCLVTCTAFEA